MYLIICLALIGFVLSNPVPILTTNATSKVKFWEGIYSIVDFLSIIYEYKFLLYSIIFIKIYTRC